MQSIQREVHSRADAVRYRLQAAGGWLHTCGWLPIAAERHGNSTDPESQRQYSQPGPGAGRLDVWTCLAFCQDSGSLGSLAGSSAWHLRVHLTYNHHSCAAPLHLSGLPSPSPAYNTVAYTIAVDLGSDAEPGPRMTPETPWMHPRRAGQNRCMPATAMGSCYRHTGPP